MPEQTTLHLPEKYAIQIRELLRQHMPDAEVWAYGSRVRGDHYDASDLDLVAHFPPTQHDKITYLIETDEAFRESNLPIIVQILDWDRVPASFQDEIRAGYVVVQKSRHTT